MAKVANTTPISAASLIVWSLVLSPIASAFVIAASNAEAERTKYDDPPTALWLLGCAAGVAALVTLCMGVYRLVRMIEEAARTVVDRDRA